LMLASCTPLMTRVGRPPPRSVAWASPTTPSLVAQVP